MLRSGDFCGDDKTDRTDFFNPRACMWGNKYM